jgi:hypothetical protein
MDADRDRAFQPRLESLEDRCLLSAAHSIFFRGRLPHHSSVAALSNGSSASSVRTIVNTTGAAQFTVSVVPRDSTPLGTSQGTPIIKLPGNLDSGLNTPGLITPATLAHDPGISVPGLLSQGTSQTATQTSTQSGGLTVSPNGTVSGSLFG